MRPVVISVGLVTVHVEREARVDDSRLIAEPMLVHASDVPAIASTKSKRRDD